MIKYFDLPTSFFLILLAWDCHTIWWEFGFGFHTSTQHRIRGPISHRCFHPQSRRDSVSRHSSSVCELRFPDPPPPLRLLTLSKSPGLLHQEHRAWPLSVQKPQPPEALGLLGIDSHSSDLETSLPAPGNFSFLVSQLYVCKTNFYYILSSVFLSLGEESFPSLLGQPYWLVGHVEIIYFGIFKFFILAVLKQYSWKHWWLYISKSTYLHQGSLWLSSNRNLDSLYSRSLDILMF